MENLLYVVFIVMVIAVWIKLVQYVILQRKYRETYKKLKDIDRRISITNDYAELVKLTEEYNEIKKEIYG